MLHILMIPARPSNHVTSAHPEFIAYYATTAFYDMVIGGEYCTNMVIAQKVMTQCEIVMTSLRVYAVTGGG